LSGDLETLTDELDLAFDAVLLVLDMAAFDCAD
jgi:hypothetical protein